MKIRSGTKDDIGFIYKKINEFNVAQLAYPKEQIWEDCSLILTDDENTIIGGITASLYMKSTLSIHVLWLDEKFRHKGIGSKLLVELENKAKSAGASLANLDTFDFQALDFYLKHGYEVFGVLEGSPCPGHKRYYLRKDIE